jgi:hypothetical protein
MELNIVLKNLVDQQSADGSWIRLNFFAENGDVAQVDVQPEDLARLGAHLTELSLKTALARELPPGVKIETHSQPLAVHNANNLKIVRWDSGGFALQLQSREGAELQIRLAPELVMALHDALDRQFPKSRAARGQD